MTENNQEWMTSAQCKDRFGLGFGRVMKLVDSGLVECRELPPNEYGEVSFLFNVADVRNYIEGLATK